MLAHSATSRPCVRSATSCPCVGPRRRPACHRVRQLRMRCRPTCLHPSGPSRAARAGSGSGRRGRVVKVPVARAAARGRSGHPEQGGRCPGGPLLVADQAAPRVRPVAAVRRARQLVRRRWGGLSAAVSVPIADLSTKAWAAHQLPPGESGSRDSAACNTWPTAGPDSSDSSSAAALGPCGTAADGRSDWRSCCLPSRNGQRAVSGTVGRAH